MYLLLHSKRKVCSKYSSILSLGCLLVLCFGNASGQSVYALPSVVMPSPQSMAFTRYGDYPMAAHNGLTDITVPIHSVEGQKLILPITMSFHASGRMANETNGTLGIRWTLNCGGLVTRTMKGLPDEWNFQTRFNVDQYINNTPPNFDTLYGACTSGRIVGLAYQDINNQQNVPKYDSEYDIFNYSLPNGKQGHFILKNVNAAKVPMIIPYEPLKIEIVKDNTSNGWIEHINITDVDGTQYVFGKIDVSTATAIEYTYEPDVMNGQIGNLPTAWYLVKIVSVAGSDQISFSYVTHYRTVWNSQQIATINDRLRDYNTSLQGGNGDAYEDWLKDELGNWHFEQDADPVSLSISRPNVPAVNGISFVGGSVSFSYNGAQLLTQIVINRASTPYKKVTFNCVKHPDEAELYYLDDIKFYGEDQVTVGEKYVFTYYDGEMEISQNACKGKDWWSYYKPSGPLLPFQNVPITPIQGGGPYTQDVGFGINRDPDDNSTIGMLKTITYPTGGQTEFVYERNQYDWAPYYVAGQNTYLLDGPGLRIKEIISSPVLGKPIHKIYKYGIYEDGRGYINECLRPASTSWQEAMVSERNVMHFWDWGMGSGYQAGYRSRTYLSDPYINFDLGGTQIKYDAVTEYYVEDEIYQQKTKTKYEWFDNDQLIEYTVFDYGENIYYPMKFANPEDAWKTPVMTGKEFYKYDNGSFDLLRRETYSYDGIGMAAWTEAYDMPTYLHTQIVYARDNGKYQNYITAKQYHDNNCSVYGYGFRRYTTGKRRLLSSKVEEFSYGGNMTTEKQYEYEDTYSFFVRNVLDTNSKGQVMKTVYSYPHDFPSVTVYQQMVQKNMIAPVISQTDSVGSSQTKKAITNYFTPFTNLFVPQTLEVKNGSGAQYTMAFFNQYDAKGNIREQQKANDVKEVYLWGYNSKYPVAKIIGTDYLTAIGYVTQSVLDAPASDAALRSHLNNLRSIPNALVVTYTYKPLVGVTSETDANGNTTYYEYDNFNRLKLIRDQDGNILKKIDYQFQSPYNQ